MIDDQPLAAVVEKTHSEIALESLRAEDRYDDSRRVREYSEHTLAIPVTAPPEETDVVEVIRQIDPDYRTAGLDDMLAERGWSKEALETVPGSWAVIGDVILVTVPEACPEEHEQELGETLLDLHGEADSVLADEGIANEGQAGIFREPKTRVIAGSVDTETVHTEHGITYGLDPAKVMFSPGNQAERVRMGSVIDRNEHDGGREGKRADEHVFDMFAGIGYFTLPMAAAGAHVTATEINPTSFQYLLENAMANDVADRVSAYRADCRDVAGEIDADRVVMGYYGHADGTDDAGHGTRTDQAHEFLESALTALEPGGILHYHETVPESQLWATPVEALREAVESEGRSLEVLEKHRVKDHSPGVSHVVIDARIS